MTNFLAKAYVLKSFAGDAVDFIRERMHDMNLDLDAERLLHRAGLSRYRPRQKAIGAFSLLCVGAAVGGILGLAFAKRPGVELRAKMKERAKTLLAQGHNAIPSGSQAAYDQPRM